MEARQIAGKLGVNGASMSKDLRWTSDPEPAADSDNKQAKRWSLLVAEFFQHSAGSVSRIYPSEGIQPRVEASGAHSPLKFVNYFSFQFATCKTRSCLLRWL